MYTYANNATLNTF